MPRVNITKEDWEAYYGVQEGGTVNMIHHAEVGKLTGLSPLKIGVIQKDYKTLYDRFVLRTHVKKRVAEDDDEVVEVEPPTKKAKKTIDLVDSDDDDDSDDGAKPGDPNWTFSKPLGADVPPGFVVFDMKPEDITKKLAHKCNCDYCDYPAGEEETTKELGIVIEEGEAFGRRIDWFGVRKEAQRCGYMAYKVTKERPKVYRTFTWTGEGWEGVGVPNNYYLGYGCFTRYEEDPTSTQPYGEHVCRMLKKVEVKKEE
jgi:hypothetical protein